MSTGGSDCLIKMYTLSHHHPNVKGRTMGNQEWPNSGYTVSVPKLRELLSVEKKKQLDKLLDDFDRDLVFELFQEELRAMGLPQPCFILFMDDESTTGEELERGEWYAVYDDDVLFTKTDTPEFVKLKKLKKKGLIPVFANWSEWG